MMTIAAGGAPARRRRRRWACLHVRHRDGSMRWPCGAVRGACSFACIRDVVGRTAAGQRACLTKANRGMSGSRVRLVRSAIEHRHLACRTLPLAGVAEETGVGCRRCDGGGAGHQPERERSPAHISPQRRTVVNGSLCSCDCDARWRAAGGSYIHATPVAPLGESSRRPSCGTATTVGSSSPRGVGSLCLS
jgi:hypothetical protein